MSTLTGTCYFKDTISAVLYYRSQGFSRKDVEAKATRGEIHIGQLPPLKTGETCVLDPNEGRYLIRSKT
jgi:hypothetical protein